MFNAHKAQVWFIERYDPAADHVALRDRIKAEGRKGRTARFIQELDEGKYDPIAEEPITISSTEVKPPTSPHPEAVVDPNNEQEPDFDNENEEEGNTKQTTEINENGKPKEGPQGGRDEECSMETEGNQVMIRTLPPDIGRVKLEQVSTVDFHIALWLTSSARHCRLSLVSCMLHLANQLSKRTFIGQHGSGLLMMQIWTKS